MDNNFAGGDQRRDFDFFVGRWTSTQRRLRKVLAGSADWYEFPGITNCWSVFDGAGNVDEVVFPTENFTGLTVRLYNAERDEWSLCWASTKSGMALPPVVGRFGDNGEGTFTSPDVYGGRDIEVMYVWSGITAEACHWEQRFSVDKGATWETNWTADFQRTE